MKGPLFYAKILLFGEYGIIKDSKGLAIPYNSYQGALKVSKNSSLTSNKSNENLQNFYQYLNCPFGLIEDSAQHSFNIVRVKVVIKVGIV